MVSKLFKLAAVPAGLALTSYGLFAATDRNLKGNRLSPNQLSVYSAPLQNSKYIEEQPGSLQSGFRVVRKTVWPYVIWGEHVCSSIKVGVQDTIQFGKDSYVYLKNPPPEFLPRLGVITVSGLAGFVLSRKGSRLKKIVYPLGLTGLGISVCYPTQAVILAKVTGKKIYTTSHRSYDAIKSLWKTSPKKGEKHETPEGGGPESPVTEGDDKKDVYGLGVTELVGSNPGETEVPILPESEPTNTLNEMEIKAGDNEAVATLVSKETKFKPDPSLLDHGQSNPEDVDMYSTRS
ncbi:MICOS complex subunit MIC27 [Pelodytes ibericus]